MVKRLKRSFRQHWLAYVMLIPAITLVIIFSYAPMYGIQIAFKDYKPKLGIWGSHWNNLKHFKRFFSSSHFPRLLKNTVTLSLYQLLAGFPAPILLALLLNEVKNVKFKKITQTISYMPYFISTVVICGMVKSFFAYDGLINSITKLLGAAPVSFLSEASLFPSIIVWLGVWQGIGWNSIIYMSALSNIDQQLYEAARIDGCGRFRQAIHVTLPGIVPTMTILLILSLGSIFSYGSGSILLLYSPLTYETGDVFSTYVYRLGIAGGEYDFTTAVSLAQTVVNFSMIILFNAISRKTTEQSLW